MIRFLVFCILLGTFLDAKSQENCYSIQILSAFNSEKNYKTLAESDFHDSCKLMQVGKTLTIRCGCYESFHKAKNNLESFTSKYPDAYIVSTNRDRFTNVQTQNQNFLHESESFEETEEELKLMLQAFLFSNDLENGYKTAKLGYKKHPTSYYWNQKVAEISKWTGRSEEAMKHMRFLYKKRYNAELEKEIVNYGLSAYQYENIEPIVVKRALKNPTKENIEMMVYIHTQIGFPERSAQILEEEYAKDQSREIFLSKILQIYLDVGDLESAKEIVNIIEAKRLYSMENVELVSYFYYLKNNMQQAYETLLLAKGEKKTIRYYELLSDLGWYMKSYSVAAGASQTLIKEKHARLVDFERVIFVNKDENFELSLQSSLQAYEQYKLSYLFYNFANESIKHKEFKQLKRVVESIEQSDSTIKDEVNYLFITAILYKNLEDLKRASEALEKALLKDTNNLQTQITALYLYLDFNLYSELTNTLELLSENSKLTHLYYYPLASIYYSIGDVNRAAYFVDKLLQENATIVQSIDFKFLEANIYNSKNNPDAFMKKIKEIIAQLQEEASRSPYLLQTDRYLNDLLQAEMYTLNPDTFEQKLISSQAYLTKEHYNEIAYSWAVKNNADEKAYKIYQTIDNRALWLRFSNAIIQEEHSEIEDLLYSYFGLLSLGDASQEAQKDGQTSLAQTLVYDALYKNDDNQNAYILHKDLSQKRSDIFDAKLSNYNRKPLLRKSLMIENVNYINDGLYLLSGVNYHMNTTLDDTELINVPDDTLEFKLGLRNEFERGYLELNAGLINSMQSYTYFSLIGSYRLNHYFSVNASINDNINTDESIQLLLGGRKDMLSLGLRWDIMNSTSLEVRYEKSAFSSQDDVAIGSGEYGVIVLGHQIRNGYPDLYLSTFMDYGTYSENDGSKGVIDELQPTPFIVLPRDFYNAGVNFSYGMQNSEVYTRVWRPYLETSAYYSSEQESFAYGLNLGYGGKVWSQDHLSLNASYSEAVNGVAGTVFEVYLRYQFLYTHR